VSTSRPGSSIRQTRQPPRAADFRGPPILQNKHREKLFLQIHKLKNVALFFFLILKYNIVGVINYVLLGRVYFLL